MLINKDKQTEQKGKKQVSNLETSHEAIRETLHTSVDPLVLVASLISPNLSSSGVPGMRQAKAKNMN